MSLATQLLRASVRSSSALRSTSSQGSTSQLFLRTYANPAGPRSDKKSDEEGVNSESENVVSTNQPQQTPRRSAATSAFDIDSSASDLVALRDSKDSSGTGAQKQGASQKRKEQSKKTFRRLLGVGAVVGVGVIINNLGREWETIDEMEKFASNPTDDNFLRRARLRLQSMYTSLQAPVWEKLLPDPLPFPYNRPYTLVVDLDDLLIHSEWSRASAWKTAKRPGLNYFLGYLSPWYEIVLFTKQPFYVVSPILEKLDPDRRYFSYQLFRESCRTLDNGQVVKDLSALNRDLSKVIVLDTDSESVQLQPENAVILKKWNGAGNDRDLIGMVDFLEAIGIYNIPDVRQTIKGYEGTHIPTEHAKRQAALKEQFEEDWKRKHQPKNSWIGGFTSATSKTDIPKTFYELEKERFQKGYMEDEKYWSENGELLRQQAEEERQKQLKDMKMSPWAFLTGQGMKPPEQQHQQQQ